jgi:hypothetical protein
VIMKAKKNSGCRDFGSNADRPEPVGFGRGAMRLLERGQTTGDF